ncbi:quinone-dependent dihydroorotate dehydrogenase [Acidithiobacillus sp. AMEEHan]|uniref:quinone-dependent dihydroorotate dehydrogenase n=1 Tax=Acidithiobacillus sp. AMEEHan TaxID=2994951 RepID=UPI0027E45D10|nr:quinone-dependent dihydroorotate dehydrogenase [Acidithiobacillus sp. AMEEHan]
MIEEQLRSWLFRFEPERAHALAMSALEALGKMPRTRIRLWPSNEAIDPMLRQTLWGLDFSHPLGLAAGFDKDARALPALAAMGFAFVEIGTITPQPQAGNPAPRLFRYPQQGAIINRLGFPSEGMLRVGERLASQGHPAITVGINLGKNKDTPLERAVEDYEQLLRHLHPFADYWVVNVSSPNTPGLRQLQSLNALRPLLSRLREIRRELAGTEAPRPLLLKIAPDLTDEEIQEIGSLAQDAQPLLEGFIATNTTISRPEGWPYAAEAGGLSGLPLRRQALAVLRQLRRSTGGQVPIIGVGGIASAEDAYERILAGASLLQSYTGWLYRGSSLVQELTRNLPEYLRRDGFSCLAEAVGQGS